MATPMIKRPGFTMMELLVYLGVFATLSLVYSAFMLDVVTNARTSRAAETVQQNIQVLMTQMAQDIRTARSVISAGPDSIVLETAAGPVTYTRGTNKVTRNTVDVSSPEIHVVRLVAATWGSGVELELEATTTDGRHPIVVSSTAIPRAMLYPRP